MKIAIVVMALLFGCADAPRHDPPCVVNYQWVCAYPATPG